MIYARIDNGVVAELFTTTGNITQLFSPTLTWVDTGTTPVSIGWTYSAGVFSAPVVLSLTADQLKTVAENAIQNLLDTTARTHGYDNIISLCSYANSTNLTWQKEGQYGCNYRDACWTKAEQIQTDATAGNWPTIGAGQVPTVNDVLAAMPAVAWPA